MKKVEVDVKLPEVPTDEEIREDVQNAGIEDVVFMELAERLSAAAGWEAAGSEAAFLQTRRLAGLSSRLQLGSRHLLQQAELLQRERARLGVLVNDARGHVTAAGDGETI